MVVEDARHTDETIDGWAHQEADLVDQTGLEEGFVDRTTTLPKHRHHMVAAGLVLTVMDLAVRIDGDRRVPPPPVDDVGPGLTLGDLGHGRATDDPALAVEATAHHLVLAIPRGSLMPPPACGREACRG